MPLNTRVGRCVTKLKHKYGYGPAIGICQHSTKQNYMTGKSMHKKNTRTRKKRGGVQTPTWIIKKTSQSVSEFENKVFNKPEYSSAEDEEAELIMHYLREEADNNDEDDVWYIMRYNDGLWYPGEIIGYSNALTECDKPCYRVDENGIRSVLKRQRSHGGRKRRSKTRRRRNRRKKTRKRHT